MAIWARSGLIKPGIRGALIVVLLILVVRAVLFPGVLAYAAIAGGHAVIAEWLISLLSPTEPASIAVLFALLNLLVLSVLNIILLVRFVQMKKGIGYFLLVVLAVQMLFDVGSVLISKFLTLTDIAVPSMHGLMIGLAVVQYLLVSPRAKTTFTR